MGPATDATATAASTAVAATTTTTTTTTTAAAAAAAAAAASTTTTAADVGGAADVNSNANATGDAVDVVPPRALALEETKQARAKIIGTPADDEKLQASVFNDEQMLTDLLNITSNATVLTSSTKHSCLLSSSEFSPMKTFYSPFFKPDTASLGPDNCPAPAPLGYYYIVKSKILPSILKLMVSVGGLSARQFFVDGVWSLVVPKPLSLPVSAISSASTSTSTSTSTSSSFTDSPATIVSGQLVSFGSWLVSGSDSTSTSSSINPLAFASVAQFAENTLSPLAVRGVAALPSTAFYLAARFGISSAMMSLGGAYRERLARMKRKQRDTAESNFFIGLSGVTAMLTLIWARNGWLI